MTYPACTRCDDAFLHARPFAGQYACDPCIRAGSCKVCREAWAVPGWDSCASCETEFYLANPADFADDRANPRLQSPEYLAIFQRVEARLPTTIPEYLRAKGAA